MSIWKWSLSLLRRFGPPWSYKLLREWSSTHIYILSYISLIHILDTCGIKFIVCKQSIKHCNMRGKRRLIPGFPELFALFGWSTESTTVGMLLYVPLEKVPATCQICKRELFLPVLLETFSECFNNVYDVICSEALSEFSLRSEILHITFSSASLKALLWFSPVAREDPPLAWTVLLWKVDFGMCAIIGAVRTGNLRLLLSMVVLDLCSAHLSFVRMLTIEAIIMLGIGHSCG